MSVNTLLNGHPHKVGTLAALCKGGNAQGRGWVVRCQLGEVKLRSAESLIEHEVVNPVQLHGLCQELGVAVVKWGPTPCRAVSC